MTSDAVGSSSRLCPAGSFEVNVGIFIVVLSLFDGGVECCLHEGSLLNDIFPFFVSRLKTQNRKKAVLFVALFDKVNARANVIELQSATDFLNSREPSSEVRFLHNEIDFIVAVSLSNSH